MAELKHYRLVGADGSIQYRSVAAGAMPPRWDKVAPRPVQVPRLPADFEDWDEVSGAYVINHGALADAEAGTAAIARAHAQKAIEALLMEAGVPIDGMIAAEARALSIDPLSLAMEVLDKVQHNIAAEVRRRATKKGVTHDTI